MDRDVVRVAGDTACVEREHTRHAQPPQLAAHDRRDARRRPHGQWAVAQLRVVEHAHALPAHLLVAEGWPAVPPALLDEGVERATDRRAEEQRAAVRVGGLDELGAQLGGEGVHAVAAELGRGAQVPELGDASDMTVRLRAGRGGAASRSPDPASRGRPPESPTISS